MVFGGTVGTAMLVAPRAVLPGLLRTCSSTRTGRSAYGAAGNGEHESEEEEAVAT